MSATGVGIRVLLDGLQLDDGCLPWPTQPPGTELRRNQALNPRPTGAISSSGWAAHIGTISGEWVVSTANGGSSQYIFATGFAEAVKTGDRVTLAIQWLVPGGTNAGLTTHIRFNAHIRSGNVYLNPHYIIPLVRDTEQRQVITWVADRDIAAGQLEISMVTCQAAGNFVTPPAGFIIQARRPMYSRGSSVGEFFDGDSPDTELEDYSWSGPVKNSASVAKAPSYPDRQPEGLVAEDGLAVDWGRTSTVGQPDAASCTFRVLDDPSGQHYSSALQVGSQVAVWADAAVSGDAVLPTFTDGGFETELRAVTVNAKASRSQARVQGGAWAGLLRPLKSTQGFSAQLPPGTLQPPGGGNPAAWDGIQTMAPGQTWRVQLKLWLGQGQTVRVRPAVYSAPYAAAVTVPGVVLATVSGPGWHTVDAAYTPGQLSGWLGVQVESSGAQRWDDLPPTQAWDAVDATLPWDDLLAVYLDDLQILAPDPGAVRSVLVFSGRVTDLEASWDDRAGCPSTQVTAVDFLGDLGNRYVGDEPWLVESVQSRVTRVLSLAAAPGDLPLIADVAPSLQGILMSWEDVDHRAAAGLLADMAQSVDGVLWSSTHAGAGQYVRIEDPAQRPALYQLELVNGVITVVLATLDDLPPEQRPVLLSACDLLRDPVSFQRDVADIATRAGVSWLEQTTDDEGQPSPTERTVTVTDAGREASFGTRSVTVSTLLTSATDATRVADQLLARCTGAWRVSGLRVADVDFTHPDASAADALLRLLDGAHRGGLPLQVTDAPSWSPLGGTIPGFLEGGQYRYTAGGWELELEASRATGLGASAAWDELDPSWTWNQWDPSLTWDQLRGVGAPD